MTEDRRLDPSKNSALAFKKQFPNAGHLLGFSDYRHQLVDFIL
jgi:hypothetical protein